MLKPCVTESAGKIHHRVLSEVDGTLVDIARIEAGYSHVQALQILAHVAGRRGYCPTIEERAVQ
jgi:hypothetical protein